jgi:hypothetical protein
VALPLTLKGIFRQTEKNDENSKIFHHAKLYNLQKQSPLKETKILQDIIVITLYIITNLKFQTQAKQISSFQKSFI